ncbi:hypothetical protein PPYR_08248 [Photinus pyralis]|uniref:CLIP domain-containing serine protease n=1 Tax=Photinus pyralis TaxID=7054 RepID=A0A5N4AIW7_PHOPY|nr:phenoloxidase-activating factor 1-like isoform X1 [Photinus pyralis]KAB0797254.1 hypothetical protein PPYR_08248 [Photinus pyralis]
MVICLVFLFAIVQASIDICTTPNNEPAQCKSLYECVPLLQGLLTQDPKVVEFVNESHCGNLSTEPLVCCGSSYTYIHGPEQIERICGYQHSDDYFRVDTAVAAIDEYPWLAILKYEQDPDLIADGNDFDEFTCVGALIGSRYVLTAAHCLRMRTSAAVGVRLGEYNINEAQDCVKSGVFEVCADQVQDIAIQSKITHPQYNRRYGLNDIALIKLKHAAVFNDFVRPICLPSSDKDHAKVGEIMQFSGFGEITHDGPSTEVKKKVLGALLSNEQCSKYYTNSTGLQRSVNENSICMRELPVNGVHFCGGDSGGPLMYSNKKRWHVEGIAAWGAQICDGRYPAVFTKVSQYLSWIMGVTES